MSSFIAGDVRFGSTVISQIVDSGYSSNAEILTAFGSTGVDPQALFGGTLEPQTNFQTTDLETLLGAIDIQAGLAIASATNIVVPFRGRSDLAEFVSGGNSVSLTAASGALAIIESIEGQMNGDVTANVRVYYKGNSGDDPFTPSATHTYGSESFVSRFTMGPVALVSSGPVTTAPDVTGWTINPGITVESQREVSTSNTGRAPAKLFITQRNPTIDIRLRSLNNMTTTTGSLKAFTGVTVYGRKRSDMGSFVANGTSEHLAFTFGAALGANQQLSGSGRQAGEMTLRLTGKSLSASAASAIS